MKLPRHIKANLCGVWSAAPTPLTSKLKIDTVAVGRMVKHHLRLGVKGLFLAGSCGEGPCMPESQRRVLVRAARKYARDQLVLAVQVTDNSATRILENIDAAKENGADIAVIAAPHCLFKPTEQRILDIYLPAIKQSPLPIGIYDLGSRTSTLVPTSTLAKILAQDKVVMLKDSSCDPHRMRMALRMKKKRRGVLRLFSGNEWDCIPYLQAGYDGLLLGGGLMNGHMANLLMQNLQAGDIANARCMQKRMNRLHWDVYGGSTAKCWLSGFKQFMIELGVFRTRACYVDFPLPEKVRRAIRIAAERDAEFLLP